MKKKRSYTMIITGFVSSQKKFKIYFTNMILLLNAQMKKYEQKKKY